MDEDDECMALRQVLEQRCPGAKFKDGDIKKLVDAGYDTETALAAASKDSLDIILPTRPGVVHVLVKAFVQPAGNAVEHEDVTRWLQRLKSLVEDGEMKGRILVNLAEKTPEFRSHLFSESDDDVVRAALLALIEPAAATDSQDRSEEWIKSMLLPQLPDLPRNAFDLGRILFPEQHGKLPVLRNKYREILMREPNVAKEFLIEADGSLLSLLLTTYLIVSPVEVISEMNMSVLIDNILTNLFEWFETASPFRFQHNLIFNCNAVTGDSLSGSTRERSRPDTLVTASGCTFLVGEDKVCSLTAAQEDLRRKILPLSPMFYGDVECILGYVAAGTDFQWVCIDKSGDIRKAGDTLLLSTLFGRCQFLLSLGYAFQLIKKMADSVPDVPGRRAMFTRVIAGDREIAFYPGYVRKSIKNFQSFCDARGTNIDLILKAYRLGDTCHSLPRIRRIGKRYVHRNLYRVEIRPIGFSPILRGEQDTRMLAKNVCEALSVLHGAGLVHRDIRLPNILQVSKEQFMLIDLETVAESPFRLPPGFERLNEWSGDTLEGDSYTPLSDMYQLGKLLERLVPWGSESAEDFIRRLIAKECTAAMALDDPWLSSPVS